MRTAPAAALVVGAAGLLLGAVLFFAGGTSVDRLFWIGAAALIVAGGAAAASLAGATPRPVLGPSGLAFLALLGGFVVWSGVSVQWSVAPDASWSYFNRDLVYLSFALLGVVSAAALPRSHTVIASGLAILLALVLGWALLGKVFPSLFPDGARNARLREPVEYWNVLGLLAVVALLLGLWLSTCRFRRLVRAAGVVLVYASIVAMVLTYSRSSLGLAVAAVVAWFALSGRAYETVAVLLLALPAVVGVLALALSLPGVADAVDSYSTRAHDGRLFGVLFIAVAAGVAGLAPAVTGTARERPRVRRALVLGATATVVAIAVAALSVSVARAGGAGAWLDARWREFARPETTAVTNQPGRLTSLNSNSRWEWWQEAWRAFRDAPVTGRGAGSFYRVHRLERRDEIGVSQPHNLPLQVLSDTGIVGFLLLGGALVAGAAAGVSTVRRLEGADRAAALALALAVCAYFLQSLVDFDWEFLAVTAPAFFVLGALAPEGAAEHAPARRPWAVAAGALAAVGVTSLLAPWLADRKVEDAYEAIARLEPERAEADARAAHRLNPLAIDPLLVWALADTLGGNRRGAYERYAQAVELQPENADAWFALGSFELRVLNEPRAAYDHLRRARELDRFAAEGELDELLAEAAAARRRSAGG